MHSQARQQFNTKFTEEQYQKLLSSLAVNHRSVGPCFRVSETPVFIPRALKETLLEACEEIGSIIFEPDFKARTNGALERGGVFVPNEDDHCPFIQMDFGICKLEDGTLLPQLIEVQGFPSLYCFQDVLAASYQKHFDVPEQFSHLLGGIDSNEYVEMLRSIIVAEANPENVVILEVEPEKQNTLIDFIFTEAKLGITTICISDLIKKDKKLYYKNEEGKDIRIDRIYNRVIFDELHKRDDLERSFYFHEEVEVTWVGHPAWFYRISKYILPLIESKYNPPSLFVDQLEKYPDDLDQYVLKPIFSFAGSGVNLNITAKDLDALEDKSNYILQRKVQYDALIPTLDDPAKCEVRMLLLWPKDLNRPIVVNNLVRLTKGDMVGIKFNKDRTWVGGSVGFFEK